MSAVVSTCEALEPLLAARMAGDVSAEEAQAITEHLADCRDCRYLAGRLESPAVAEALASAADDERDFPDLAIVDTDNYVRGQEIGRGGMGRIVRARDRRLGRAVAIKELIDERMRSRFEREARLTARLQHPAIVSVHEAGRWPSGEPFYAMKYVAGRRLDRVIADTKSVHDRLPLLPNLLTVVEAIAYAHAEGVIHRDVKPQNILIGAFGESVVIDWGLAKDMGDPGDAEVPYRDLADELTIGGAGTPAYMAPEQARGETPDERVDVYSLGATLHHLLAGKAPERGQPLGDDIPVELRAIVAKATAADREVRYRTAAELAGELRRYQSGQLVGAHRYRARELVSRWVRRHRAIVALSAAFVLALTGGGIVSVQRIVASAAEAREQRDHAAHALAESLYERGRIELVGGEPTRALPYLVEALKQGIDTPELRLMLGLAERSTDALVLSIDDVMGAAALDPAGRRLAVAGPGNAVRIVGVPDGTTLVTLEGHTATVGHLAWSLDGNTLATAAGSSADATLRVWNAADGRALASLPVGGAVASLAFGRDGKLVVAAGSHAVVWNGTTTVDLPADDRGLTSASFDPEGKRVVTSGSGGVAKIYDAATGTLLVTLTGHTSGIQGASFDASGQRVVTAGWDHQAIVWDAATGARVATLDIGNGSVYEAVFSPDGARVAVRSASTATVFKIDGQKVNDLEGERQPSSVAWADSDRILVAGRDGSVHVFDDHGTHINRLDGHVGATWGLSVGRRGTLAATAGRDGTAKVWATRSTAQLERIHASGARFDGKGHLVTSQGEDLVDVWDEDSGELVDVMNDPLVTWGMSMPCRLADGSVVVVIDGASIWDPTTRKRSPVVEGARCLDELGRGSAMWNRIGDSQRLVDPLTGKLLVPAVIPDLRDVVLAPNHLRLAGTDPDRLRITVVDATTGAIVTSFAMSSRVNGVRFTPDGSKLVVFGAFGDPELREATTGRVFGLFGGHHGPVSEVVLSGDGRLLLTAGEDRTIRLFSVATQDALAVFPLRTAGNPIALDEHGTRAFFDGRLLALTPDHRPLAAIAARVEERVPYALEAGRLVVKLPVARLAGTLPPPGLPAGARPICDAGSIPRGAIFPFGHLAWCQGPKQMTGARTVWSATGVVIDQRIFDDVERKQLQVPGLYGVKHERAWDRLGRIESEKIREDPGPDAPVILRRYEDGHVALEESRDQHGIVGLRRVWHKNGALAEEADYPVCHEEPICQRRFVKVRTFDEEGHKRSEGQRIAAFEMDAVAAGPWRFWNRRGDETKFDFGCPLGDGGKRFCAKE